MFETVLVPLDGSELAEAALEPAAELKNKLGARVILLRVLEPLSHMLSISPPSLESPAAAATNVDLLQEALEAERRSAREYLEQAAARVGADGVEPVVAEGRPQDVIPQQASETGAGLIIMSSHGRGGLGRLVYGSVTDSVLKESSVPVLLIRLNDEKD